MSQEQGLSCKWCLTYFPKEEETIDEFYEKLIDAKSRNARIKTISFGIIGEEYAPTTGKRHFQCYIETPSRKRMNTLKNELGYEEIHMEIAKGSRIDNIKYCKKENSEGFPEKVIRIIGTEPTIEEEQRKNSRALNSAREREERKKNDMKTFLADLRTRTMEYIEEEYPVRYYREMNLIQRYRLDKAQGSDVWDGDLKKKNYWVWGKTGTGKSSWARRQLHDGAGRNVEIYNKSQNKWWDGYVCQRIVLVEDWNGGENNSFSKMLLHHLKIWADRYTFNAEIKGGTMSVFPGRFFFIVTSNHSIDDVFQGCDNEDIDAIKRRFSEVEIKSLQDIFLSSNLDPEIIAPGLYK